MKLKFSLIFLQYFESAGAENNPYDDKDEDSAQDAAEWCRGLSFSVFHSSCSYLCYLIQMSRYFNAICLTWMGSRQCPVAQLWCRILHSDMFGGIRSDHLPSQIFVRDGTHGFNVGITNVFIQKFEVEEGNLNSVNILSCIATYVRSAGGLTAKFQDLSGTENGYYRTLRS